MCSLRQYHLINICVAFATGLVTLKEATRFPWPAYPWDEWQAAYLNQVQTVTDRGGRY